MKKKNNNIRRSRKQASIINFLTAGFAQVTNLVLQFVARTFFIHILGEQYLGLNGLFVNILNVLSFAELGIGSAITFTLYKPLVDGDNNKILSLMQLYRKAYYSIAGIILILGLSIMPFLSVFIKGNTLEVGNIHLAFFLFLLNSVASYLWNYKRSIFFADQRGYINSLNTLFFQVGAQVLQIILLFTTPSYYGYLSVQLLLTICSNLQISRTADKFYPFLRSKKKVKVDKKTIRYLSKNVIGMMSSKIGGIIVLGTDNLLLSAFLGLIQVAKYSNYTLIINGLTSILNQAISSVTASIGNLKANGNGKKEVQVFYQYFLISSILGFAICVGMITFFPAFISSWVGEKYILDPVTTWLISFNFFIAQLRQPIINFTNAYGLYWEQRYKPFVESGINLVVSLLLITYFDLGIKSVIIGNLCSNLLVNAWWEPLIIFKYGFRNSLKKFGWLYLLILVISIFSLITAQRVSMFLANGSVIFQFSMTIVFVILWTVSFIILISGIYSRVIPEISLKKLFNTILKR